MIGLGASVYTGRRYCKDRTGCRPGLAVFIIVISCDNDLLDVYSAG